MGYKQSGRPFPSVFYHSCSLPYPFSERGDVSFRGRYRIHHIPFTEDLHGEVSVIAAFIQLADICLQGQIPIPPHEVVAINKVKMPELVPQSTEAVADVFACRGHWACIDDGAEIIHLQLIQLLISENSFWAKFVILPCSNSILKQLKHCSPKLNRMLKNV